MKKATCLSAAVLQNSAVLLATKNISTCRSGMHLAFYSAFGADRELGWLLFSPSLSVYLIQATQQHV